jgi:CubicO group peptidase (beta-lactamase class C family)
MKSWLAGAVGAYLLGCATALAQNPDAPAITKRLDKIAKSYPEEQFMGSVLVVEGDHTLLDKGYGMADLKRKIPDSPDAQFRLGSLTKQFTAALILLLQQDGKLQVADPASKYLDDAPQTWKKITVANLLGHTSGIPNFTSDPAFRTWSLRPHSREEEIGLFRDKPLEFAPGSRYEYSNSNYEVLGAVIENVSGRDHGDDHTLGSGFDLLDDRRPVALGTWSLRRQDSERRFAASDDHRRQGKLWTRRGSGPDAWSESGEP